MSNRVLSGQMDMFAEHFREANPEGSFEPRAPGTRTRFATDPEEVSTSFDKSGQMIYLRRSRIYGSESRESGAWKNDGDGYSQVSSLLSAPTFRDPSMHQVELVETNESEQKRGIGSQVWDMASRGADLRHSMDRYPAGVAFAYSVGGLDTAGRDVRSYDYYEHPESKRGRDGKPKPSPNNLHLDVL